MGAQGSSDCLSPGSYCEATASFGLGDVPRYGRGASVADIDSDGWLDLFIVDTDHPNRDPASWGRSRMYRNLGGSGFLTIDVGIADAHVEGAWLGSFGDFDNDGDPDLMIAAGGYTTYSTLSFYENRMDSEGRFVDATEELGAAPGDLALWPFWGIAWSDYDEDGWLDVVVTRRVGGPLLFHNLGDGSFEEVSSALGVEAPEGIDGKNPIWIDFDRDGDEDLYIGGMDADGFYRNDGGTFTQLPSPLADLPEGPYSFASLVADFDQDGYDDIYVGRWSCQDFVLFGGPGGSFTRLGPEIGLDALTTCPMDASQTTDPFENTMGLSMIDLFDDGYPDIYIGTGDPSQSAADIIYCNQGNRVFQRCTDLFFNAGDPHLETRGHGTVQGDFDGDGDGDIYFNLGGHTAWDIMTAEDTRETDRFFLYDSGVSPNSIVLSLEGTISNRDAVGARVVATGGRTSYRVVRSSQGFQSQNSPELIIPADGADEVEVQVQWPRGGLSILTMSPGERVHLIEDSTIPTAPTAPSHWVALALLVTGAARVRRLAARR